MPPTPARAAAPKPRTVLFQAPNQIGLGHINRLAAIALAMRETHPDIASLFLVEGHDHGFLKALGLPVVSLPRMDLLVSPDWSAWPQAQRERLLGAAADAAFDAFAPAAVVFDTVHHQAVAFAAHRRKVPVGFVARKVKSLDAYAGDQKALLNYAAAILVPHAPGEFEMPRQWQAKTHHVGTILRRRRPAAAPGFDLAVFPAPRVVITGGGGGYAGTSAFYNLAAASCRAVRTAVPSLTALLVAGPLFTEWGALKADGATVLPSHWDMPGLYAAADLVLCQAGYNTVAELLDAGVPAIAVPAERELDNQALRARLAAEAHPGFRVIEEPVPEALAARIVAVLAEARLPGPRTAEAEGAVLAARIVAKIAGAAAA